MARMPSDFDRIIGAESVIGLTFGNLCLELGPRREAQVDQGVIAPEVHTNYAGLEAIERLVILSWVDVQSFRTHGETRSGT